MKFVRLEVKYYLLFLVFFIFYILGALFPDKWWSTHFVFFLSENSRFLILGGALVIPLVFYYGRLVLNKDTGEALLNIKHTYLYLVLSLFVGLLMYYFPMVFDYYGEAVKLQGFLNIVPESIPPGTNDALFSFRLSPWAGQNTILSIVTYIAFWTGSTYQNAFFLLNAFTGGLFAFLWFCFIDYYFRRNSTRFILQVAGLISPFLLLFFGHIEIYGPVFLFNLFWLITFIIYLKRRQPAYLVILGILLLFCLKLHAVALLFLPAYILIILNYYKKAIKTEINFFTWRVASVYVLLPVFLIGTFVYFFVFKDHVDERQLQYTVAEYDRIFLPLISPEPPLDKYNMLSWNHIFDYFNEMFLWSPGILFLLLAAAIFFRKKINFNQPELILTGITLILFVSLFFVVNPLLSMQMDWDLFLMPVPALLVFGVVIFKQTEDDLTKASVSGIVVALGILSLPIFVVHNSEEKLANRTEKIGLYIYKTYYEWSGQTLELAWKHVKEDKDEFKSRRMTVIGRLKTFAIPGKDYEMARIIANEAMFETRVNNNPAEGLKLARESKYYFTNYNKALLFELESLFLMGKYNEAYQVGLNLLDIAYPSREKALRILVHCALEAEMYQQALVQSENYIKEFNPEDKLIKRVYSRLKTNDNIGELKYLFSGSN
ncbi:hypothetical protein GM418_11755 [Maribellus comscasis]|uniref:Uncharacterized protein n=1 Tax=Maribellus comscasis TaxID=2681766 RepID=A0A6I6JW41_9BACT|nr:hypothetical protein [Maribellus comscasis]QGY44307.1 hypothetical protein GM418_11755 [Maribellus comscasis]